jgi:hypothetical protein
LHIKTSNIPLCPKCGKTLIHSWGYLWQCFDCRIKVDRRCIDCPNADTLCNSKPNVCGFYKETKRDWKVIRDRHIREKKEKAQQGLNFAPLSFSNFFCRRLMAEGMYRNVSAVC